MPANLLLLIFYTFFSGIFVISSPINEGISFIRQLLLYSRSFPWIGSYLVEDKNMFWWYQGHEEGLINLYFDIWPFQSQKSLMTKHLDILETPLFLKFRNRLMKKGNPYGKKTFEDFLFFLKMFTRTPILLEYFFYRFFRILELPYRICIIRFSNRNYYYPGHIKYKEDNDKFILKGLISALKSPRLYGLHSRGIFELFAFLANDFSTSGILKYLYNIIDTGYDNRAFIHYRWVHFKKKM